MATDMFLAMTGAEIGKNSSLPPKIGWMACHFSPYAVGLSNLPTFLPPDSLLILNDITPIHGHSKEVICRQLQDCAEQFRCRALLLDFQRPDCQETAELAAYLTKNVPIAVAVSASYAEELDCPVFLPPLPHHMPLEEHIAPWQNRQIWLEAALDAEQITVTDAGAVFTPLLHGDWDSGRCDPALKCHYRVELSEDSAQFTLWRRKDDVQALLAEADSLGIHTAVGLYQELGEM